MTNPSSSHHENRGSTPGWILLGNGWVSITLKVHPRASRNEIGPVEAGMVKVRVTAPPVDSEANEAVLRLLAEALDCSRSSLDLLRGHTSRIKVVRITGLSPEEVAGRLRL